MIQFQVPQFIDTEDKIVGPLSMRQFAYLGASAGITGIFLFVLEFWLWVIIATILLGIGAFLAFGRMNGRPITIYVKALFQNIWAPSIYTFGAKQPDAITKPDSTPTFKVPKRKPTPKSIPKPDLGGIKDLWQKMNTSKKAIPRRETALPNQNQSFSQFKERFEAVRHITGEREVAKRVDYR